MMGLGGVRADDDPLGKILELFDDAGYIGVVATNCEQTYHRYLRPGEEVSVAAELTDVVGPKQTALGEAFFITQRITWSVGDEDVAEMMWRIMKFIPADSRPRPQRVGPRRPGRRLRDASGVVEGHEVLLGRRQRPRTAHPEAADGSLQHPPVPALWLDREAETDYSGRRRQGHGVQLRRAPRAEGARPHAAVRHRTRRTRRRRADARRAAQRRSRQRARSECPCAPCTSTSRPTTSGRHGPTTPGSLPSERAG